MAPPARALSLLCLLALVPAVVGCAATIVPPPVDDPRRVQVLDHGRHTTLLLTAADRTRYRYAYADWDWYVEGEHDAGSAWQALFSPSRAAFGRQALPPRAPDISLEQEIGIGIERTLTLQAEAERVDALLDSLGRSFHASPEAPRYNPEVALELVPHPRPYTFGYNSNHMVADWLRELGFTVRGDPTFGRWELADAAGE